MGFLLSYDICILYIFTSLFPSHNHPIREAGQLLADKRIESRGAGWPADLSGLQALWDQQGPAAGPKAKGLLGSAGVQAEGGESAFSPLPLPSFHSYSLCTHYMPGTVPAAGCPLGMKQSYLTFEELRPDKEADRKPTVPC